MRGRRLFIGCLGAALVAAGCREQVFEPVKNGLVASAHLSGDVVVTTKADLLFVVDDSASMQGEQEKLAAGFPALVTKLEALDPPVDYRLAVMTTSIDEHFGPCNSNDPDAPASCSAMFGGTGFTCEAGACVRRFPGEAGRLVAAPGNPTVLDRADHPPAELATMFEQNVKVGTSGARQEQPLRAFRLALANHALDAFLRPDAKLIVVVATDEDDCSDSTGKLLKYEDRNGTLVNHCAEESATDTGALDSLSAWEEAARALVTSGRTREVVVGAIVGLADGTQNPGTCVDTACAQECQGPANQAACDQACQGALRPELCTNDCVDECVSFCGASEPPLRLARVVRDFAGPLESICASDFGPGLGRLASVLGIPSAIDLPSTPGDDDAFFFTVTRGGKTISCIAGRDYTLDRTTTPPELDIAQSGRCRLLPGDHWDVRYLTDP